MNAQPKIAMTPQQRELSSGGLASLEAYRNVMVGDRGWGNLFGFELARLLFTNTNGLIGIAMRRLAYPWFFRSCKKGLAIGNGVTIRQPHRISLGRSVVIDDYALLDVRTRPGMDQDAFVELGDHVYLGRYSTISAKYGQIVCGNAVNIGSYTRIASHERIEIGDSTLIASFVYIGAGNHRFDSVEQPVMEQEMQCRGGVQIGTNVWIGTRATILDGVKIGKDAIIGAHALVRDDVPERAIVAGVPARVIRYRE